MAGATKANSTSSKSKRSPSASSGTKSSTRTSARSAKRRSPKSDASEDDGELLELERVEFLKAMDKYKRRTGQTFPSWSEVLNVLRGIGWTSPMRIASREPASRS